MCLKLYTRDQIIGHFSHEPITQFGGGKENDSGEYYWGRCTLPPGQLLV